MSSQASKTFVLVAGAGHGGWVWRELREGLLSAGHRVFTPTLTGVGERSHLMSSDITLSTHIDDVANLFLWEDLQDVILVGHSYAGWVISGAVEKLEGRVNAIIYLDAFLPEDQNRGLDFLNEKQKEAFSQALERNEASRAGPTSAALRIQDPVKAAWVDSKITPQPIGVSLERLQLTGARERVPSKLYVRTPLFPQPYFDEALARCEADPSWRTAILPDCGHDPMVDRPDLVMDLLLSMS